MTSRTGLSLAVGGFLCFGLLIGTGCRTERHTFDEDTAGVTTSRTGTNDTMRPQPTTPVVHDSLPTQPASDLPPVATPIPPEKLATFIPQLSGYQASEANKEIKVHKGENFSRASQSFTQGEKKFTIEINDYAYVPAHYAAYDSYLKEDYLHEDNNERTETTNVKGYRALQTWEKKSNDATVTVFPGKRFIVRVLGDNLSSLSEARTVMEQIDLMKLETLQ
jgi:hypothetical protein